MVMMSRAWEKKENGEDLKCAANSVTNWIEGLDVVSIFETDLSSACGHLKARLTGKEWQELPSLHRRFLPVKPLEMRILNDPSTPEDAPSRSATRSAQLPSRLLQLMDTHFSLAIVLISISHNYMSSCFCRSRRRRTARAETAERLTTATAGYSLAGTHKKHRDGCDMKPISDSV